MDNNNEEYILDSKNDVVHLTYDTVNGTLWNTGSNKYQVDHYNFDRILHVGRLINYDTSDTI